MGLHRCRLDEGKPTQLAIILIFLFRWKVRKTKAVQTKVPEASSKNRNVR
ncbi:hypothetical protein RSAG8_02913, partial [Rhizoctonia solani AG-8 WAC10335]